jgi:polysaccharide export outer membrane protein
MLKTRSRHPLVTVTLALLLGVSCAAPARTWAAEEKGKAPAAKPAPAELYKLRTGDEISITVNPQKEYDCTGTVLPDGRLYLRTVGGGAIKALGMSLPELEETLTKKLAMDLVAPEVRVTLLRIAPEPMEKPVEPAKPGKITLVGAIGKSGPMELEPGLRLRKALDLAGGASKEADLSRVSIIHPDLTRTIVDISTPERVLNPAHNLILRDGDSVDVPSLPPAPATVANPVRVAGQIANPGQFELKQGMTLEDLILLAGRPTILADLSHVELRRTGQQPKVVNLFEQREQGLNGTLKLEPGDEVFLPEFKDTLLLIGALTTPGARPVKAGTPIREFFLSPDQAAIINPTNQDLDKVRVIRRGQKEPFTVDLDGVLKKPNRKDNITLQPGDVIFISPRDQNQQGGLLGNLGRFLPAGWLFGLF